MDRDPTHLIRERRGLESGSGGPTPGAPMTPLAPWAPHNGGQQHPPGEYAPGEPPFVDDPPDHSWREKHWDQDQFDHDQLDQDRLDWDRWDDGWEGRDSWDGSSWDIRHRIHASDFDDGGDSGKPVPLVEDLSEKGEPGTPPVEPIREGVSGGELRQLPGDRESPFGDSWQEGPWERGVMGRSLDSEGSGREGLDAVREGVSRGELKELPGDRESPFGDSWQEGPWERGVTGEPLGKLHDACDPATPLIEDAQMKGEPGLPAVEPTTEYLGERLLRQEVPPDPSGGDDLIQRKVAWPEGRDNPPGGENGGGEHPPVEPEAFRLRQAQVSEHGTPELGEVLIRKTINDPDGDGPLAPEVSYEAVRILPEGSQRGEPLRESDLLLWEAKHADPDGDGPLEPPSHVELVEGIPHGWEGLRVERVSLELAPPTLRDIAMFSDPDGAGPAGPYARGQVVPHEEVPKGEDKEGLRLQPMPNTPVHATDQTSTQPPPSESESDKDEEQGKDENEDKQDQGQDDEDDKDEEDDKQDKDEEDKDEEDDKQNKDEEDKGEKEKKGSGGGGPGSEQNGRVSPDPNLKFDEASYNQLLGTIHAVRLSLKQDSLVTPEMTIDDQWQITPPGNNNWDLGRRLHERGTSFGGSMFEQTNMLHRTMAKFEVALRAGKEAFKDTDDLAAYSASVFTSEYPDFQSGPTA